MAQPPATSSWCASTACTDRVTCASSSLTEPHGAIGRHWEDGHRQPPDRRLSRLAEGNGRRSDARRALHAGEAADRRRGRGPHRPGQDDRHRRGPPAPAHRPGPAHRPAADRHHHRPAHGHGDGGGPKSAAPPSPASGGSATWSASSPATSCARPRPGASRSSAPRSSGSRPCCEDGFRACRDAVPAGLARCTHSRCVIAAGVLQGHLARTRLGRTPWPPTAPAAAGCAGLDRRRLRWPDACAGHAAGTACPLPAVGLGLPRTRPCGPYRWPSSSRNAHSRTVPGLPLPHPDGGRPELPTHLPGDGGSRHRTGTARARHPSFFILFRPRLPGNTRVLHGEAEVHDDDPEPAGSAARRRRRSKAGLASPATSTHSFPTSTLFTCCSSRKEHS